MIAWRGGGDPGADETAETLTVRRRVRLVKERVMILGFFLATTILTSATERM